MQVSKPGSAGPLSVDRPSRAVPASAPAGTWHWAAVLVLGGLAGLVAALGMTLLLLLFRQILGFATPSEMVGDRLTAFISIKQFFALLDQFGGYSGLKQAGGGGVIVGQLVVGILGGLIYAAAVERDVRGQTGRSRGALWTVIGIVLALWLLSVGLLWPVLATNYFGLPPDTARLTTALGLLVSYSGYGVILVLAYRALRGRTPAGLPSAASASRRLLLVGGSGALLALVTANLVRQLVQRATFSYDGTEYRGDNLQPITPNDRFYTVTKNIVDPDPTTAVWRLEVGGLVDRPHTYGFDELAGLPSTTQETTLMCISNYVGGGLMSNAVWKGLALRDLLAAAGPHPNGTQVLFYGADGYTVSYPLEKAMEPTTFVAFEMNGEPLPAHHGFPARVLTPGLFGLNSVKWVTRIELIDHEVKGFYAQQGWGPSFVIPTRSNFIMGNFQTAFTRDVPISVRGIAFGGNRGVARVDVSADGGQTWQEARIDYPGTPVTWAFWTFDFLPSGPGEYHLVARATDGQGGVQTNDYRDTQPEGANGFHSLTVGVTA